MAIQLAPVALFAYKRLDTLQKVITSLQENYLARETELFVFSDGWKSQQDKVRVEEVQHYLEGVEGFKKVTLTKSESNRGLAKSVIKGVSEVLQTFNNVIVLEDDIVTTPNFLDFMNQALETYAYNKQINTVSGYTFSITPPPQYVYDNFLHKRASSWGWATWSDRWNEMNWNILHEVEPKVLKSARVLGSDFPSLITKARTGVDDSWAIPWQYHQYISGLVTVYPLVSKVQNIGFGVDATHTKKSGKRFTSTIDKNHHCKFKFTPESSINPIIAKQFNKKFTYAERLRCLLSYYWDNALKGI